MASNGLMAAGQAYSGTAQQNAATRQSQTGMQLERLAMSMKTIHGMLETLESRISVILRPDSPSPSSEGQEKMALVPFADNLANIAGSLELANRRIASLLDRIEL